MRLKLANDDSDEFVSFIKRLESFSLLLQLRIAHEVYHKAEITPLIEEIPVDVYAIWL